MVKFFFTCMVGMWLGGPLVVMYFMHTNGHELYVWLYFEILGSMFSGLLTEFGEIWHAAIRC